MGGEEERDLSRGRQDKDMRKNMEHEGTGRREGGKEEHEPGRRGRAWKKRRREGGREGLEERRREGGGEGLQERESVEGEEERGRQGRT